MQYAVLQLVRMEEDVATLPYSPLDVTVSLDTLEHIVSTEVYTYTQPIKYMHGCRQYNQYIKHVLHERTMFAS